MEGRFSPNQGSKAAFADEEVPKLKSSLERLLQLGELTSEEFAEWTHDLARNNSKDNECAVLLNLSHQSEKESSEPAATTVNPLLMETINKGLNKANKIPKVG